LTILVNTRAWVTLKRVNSEMEPCKKFIISRLICSARDFEIFINASWCKNILFNSSSFLRTFTSSRNCCTISSACGRTCRTVLMNFNFAILTVIRMVDKVTPRSSLVIRTWDIKLTRKISFNATHRANTHSCHKIY